MLVYFRCMLLDTMIVEDSRHQDASINQDANVYHHKDHHYSQLGSQGSGNGICVKSLINTCLRIWLDDQTASEQVSDVQTDHDDEGHIMQSYQNHKGNTDRSVMMT